MSRSKVVRGGRKLRREQADLLLMIAKGDDVVYRRRMRRSIFQTMTDAELAFLFDTHGRDLDDVQLEMRRRRRVKARARMLARARARV